MNELVIMLRDMITAYIRIFLESLRKIKKIINHKKPMDKETYSDFPHSINYHYNALQFLVVEEIGYSLNADMYALNLLDVASKL